MGACVATSRVRSAMAYLLYVSVVSYRVFIFIFLSIHSAILDGMGKNMEVAKYTEKLVPSTRFVAVDGVAPVVSHAASTFVAPSASVIGNVTIGKSSR